MGSEESGTEWLKKTRAEQEAAEGRDDSCLQRFKRLFVEDSMSLF